MQSNPMTKAQPDTFVCDATEDKDSIARPIHHALTKLGVYAWLDESEIRLGQSIRKKIDDGLANCRSATVILSRPFFSKRWTQYELDGIVGRQMQGEILLFPIQHGITIDEIRKYSPSLAGLSLWNSSDYAPEQIASEIAGQLGVEVSAASPTPEASRIHASEESPAAGGTHGFGAFYVAPPGTEELRADMEPELDPLVFFSNPADLIGWIPVVESGEELEFALEGKTLRVRLSWGNSWEGSELTAAQILSGDGPFALTIRQARGGQIYLPTVVNRSPASFLLGPSSRSGWMTFLIG